MANKEPMKISMRTFFDEDTGTWGVQVMVMGLENEKQANLASDFIQDRICGDEQFVN